MLLGFHVICAWLKNVFESQQKIKETPIWCVEIFFFQSDSMLYYAGQTFLHFTFLSRWVTWSFESFFDREEHNVLKVFTIFIWTWEKSFPYYRVCHSKDWKVIMLWWGYRFWFLLIFWILHVHEIGAFIRVLVDFFFVDTRSRLLQWCAY